MEPLKEPISVRVARINSSIIGKSKTKEKSNILNREALLDTLQVLYDECTIENLQKYDANIARFAEKYKPSLKEIKQLRVNVTDFEIKNVIGRGHFGEVHVVKEKQTGDVYAMKTIRKNESDIKCTNFEEERNIMAFGHSPWLTSLQYAFQDSTYLFFVMEFHPGGDLLGLLYRQGGTLPESAALFYIAELVLALEDLHNMGYVHRDIKPDNLLLDRCGHLKLADFGSAAKLNSEGLVMDGPPVGTPDYIAPEVLQSLENKNKKNSGYGVCCDFWSLGVLAYELTIGNTPFTGQNTTSIYGKIMNHSNSLKFPPDLTLSQAYITFIKGLITDKNSRLNQQQIKTHPLFKNTKFDTLLNEVPPYVPKITSAEDTSNFTDIIGKKKTPSMENLKKRTQFSGRNLPFIGFTYTHDPSDMEDPYEKMIIKDETVQNLKGEITKLQRKLLKNEENIQGKEVVEMKLEERSIKVKSLESLRDNLEREVANSIAECTALKRTLELERKDRVELERKALDLIKAAKVKWETAQKNQVEALILELEHNKEKLIQLTNANKILNEQLEHALKMEGKHKESLEKVEHLSRRSVIGLESRLEKVTSETQNTIHELRSKLSMEQHAKFALENQITKLKNKDYESNIKIEKSEADYNVLKDKMDLAEEIIGTLNEKVEELATEMADMETYRDEVEKLQHTVDDSQKTIKDLENKNTLLRIEQQSVEKTKREWEEQSNIQARKIRELESQLHEERESNQSLKKQLKESENTITESQELRELRTKYWRMEKEFGNCKIDKRILERELKDAQTEIKELKERLESFDEKLADNKKANEAALLEISGINDSLTLELMKLKDSYKNLQEKLENERKKSDDEETIIAELKKIVSGNNEKVKSLIKEITDINLEKSTLEKHLNNSEKEKTRLLDLVDNLQKEKSELFNNLEKAQREVHNTNLNMGALKEACSLLENQVIEFEKIITTFENKERATKANTEKLIQDVFKAKNEVQEAKQQYNEEKSFKLLAETKVKRLNEDIECLQNECKSYKEQCMEYKQYSTGLSDELTIAEEKITDLEMAIKNLERQNKDISKENNLLKEEMSQHLSKIHSLKEDNYKHKHQIRDLHENKNVLLQQLQELERIFNEKMNYYKERELKSDSTIKQQIKLIDYLQSKIDDYSHKKKTISEKLFGSAKKENTPPILAMNYKDLEQQLNKERLHNKNLQEEIYRLKAGNALNILEKTSIKQDKHKTDTMSPQIKAAMKEIVNSPSKQKALIRHNSSKRMHHNIPHRFESKLCTKSIKCLQCENQILIGRHYNQCYECSITVHVNCSSLVPRTCGLPHAFAEHFKESLTKLNEKSSVPVEKQTDEPVNVEGWIKVPSKSNKWEKQYACLSNNWLKTYTGSPKDSTSCLLETFELKPLNSTGKIILEPLASEVGIPVANSDLPFVIKIEVSSVTTCWPSKCFILMTLSAQQTDQWFHVLQGIFGTEQELTETILTVPDMSVNCIIDLSESIHLLGTSKGLYSYYNDTLVHIEGLSSVNQIGILSGSNVVAMIVNSKNTLISCDLNHLINLTQCASCTKPTLKYKNVKVNNLNSFHFLQVSKYEKVQKIAIATSKQLIILMYNSEFNEFIPERILDTAEPTSCVLFTENSVIVGADKYFEIDLTTYEADEFLDASDFKLQPAVMCYKMKSFPMDIIEVNKNPKEYLLCFSEFGIFVDEYGRSSRDDNLKSQHLPVAFHYIKPYLFVVQFNAVEVVKIIDESLNENMLSSVRYQLDKVNYLGGNKRGIYVLQNKQVKFMDIKFLPDINESSLMSETTDNNESDRFSFTSSMVQSLDGHLSDDSNDEKTRKVTFSQTEL